MQELEAAIASLQCEIHDLANAIVLFARAFTMHASDAACTSMFVRRSENCVRRAIHQGRFSHGIIIGK
jgi:hypothetical protein